MSVLNVTEKDFDQVINSGKLVLVDFWAVWCRPCQMMGPVMEELAQEYDGKLVVAKVNVDEAENLCVRFGITNIPNMKFFKNGVEVGNVVGAVPKSTLVAATEKNQSVHNAQRMLRFVVFIPFHHVWNLFCFRKTSRNRRI